MKVVSIVLSFLTASFLFGQNEVSLIFQPEINGQNLQLNQVYQSATGTYYDITVFNYYLSNLVIHHDGGQISSFTDTVFLVKADTFRLNLGSQAINELESIDFSIGVPTNLNTSSGTDAIDITEYPAGHPLSFQTPSMYWGWTSGYATMIVSGEADTDNDQLPDNVFEIHTFGSHNFKNVQLNVIQTNSAPGMIEVFIECNLDNWLNGINLETVGIAHGTDNVNEDIMNNVNLQPVFTQPETASIAAVSPQTGEFYFYSEANQTVLVWKAVYQAEKLILTDFQGKKLSEQVVTSNGKICLPERITSCFATLYDENGKLLNTLKIVNR